MADDAPVVADLMEGRLVRLFDVEIATDQAYLLVCPVGSAERP